MQNENETGLRPINLNDTHILVDTDPNSNERRELQRLSELEWGTNDDNGGLRLRSWANVPPVIIIDFGAVFHISGRTGISMISRSKNMCFREFVCFGIFITTP